MKSRLFLVLIITCALSGCGTNDEQSNLIQNTATPTITIASEPSITEVIETASPSEVPVVENSTDIIYVEKYDVDVSSEDNNEGKVIVNTKSHKIPYMDSYLAPDYNVLESGVTVFADFVNGKTDELVIEYQNDDGILDELTVFRQEDGTYIFDSLGYQEWFKDVPEGARYFDKYTHIAKVVVEGYTLYFLASDNCDFSYVSKPNIASVALEMYYIPLFTIK